MVTYCLGSSYSLPSHIWIVWENPYALFCSLRLDIQQITDRKWLMSKSGTPQCLWNRDPWKTNEQYRWQIGLATGSRMTSSAGKIVDSQSEGPWFQPWTLVAYDLRVTSSLLHGTISSMPCLSRLSNGYVRSIHYTGVVATYEFESKVPLTEPNKHMNLDIAWFL